MSNQKASTLVVTLLVLAAFLFTGCSSKNVQIDPKNLPPVIKTYKHIILSGGTIGPKDTGVYIEDDDLFTIMATGSMDFCRGHCKWSDVRPELGWPLIARIGEVTTRVEAFWFDIISPYLSCPV